MLLGIVENFIRRHRFTASGFGLQAAGDPCLVRDLRAGRAPRPAMDARLRGFMAGYSCARENTDVG